jgi:prevent-host-death family protein
MSDTVQIIERTIPASQFKTHCLALLDEVAESGVAIVVTKHGKPVARLEPIEPPPSLRGSVTYHVSDEELIAPLWESWDPELP